MTWLPFAKVTSHSPCLLYITLTRKRLGRLYSPQARPKEATLAKKSEPVLTHS